jgi:cytoskeletal protein RodZ
MNNLNPTTNQRQWEHKAHTTHDKEKHNKAKKTKEMNVRFRLFISLVFCVVLCLSLWCVVCALCSHCLWFVVGFRLFISLVFCALLCLSSSCVVCALQRQWEHKAHTTHNKDKHNKAQETKEMSNLNPTTNQRQWEHKAHTTGCSSL